VDLTDFKNMAVWQECDKQDFKFQKNYQLHSMSFEAIFV
jgi:hypothetical protein